MTFCNILAHLFGPLSIICQLRPLVLIFNNMSAKATYIKRHIVDINILNYLLRDN